MLFLVSQIEIPKKRVLSNYREIPLGMIGAISVELKRDIFGGLVISTPYADFEVRGETPSAVAQELDRVVKYFVNSHPEFLYLT